MNLVLSLLFILFVFIVGIIPFFLLYLFSDFVKFLLLRVFRYRKKIVELNLKTVFPNKTDKDLRSLISNFYTNLSDVLIEGIKAFTMTKKQVILRHNVLNPEISELYFREGRSVIAVPSHYGNWEWGSMSGGLQLSHNFVVMYKPLSNKWIDKFVRWSRAKYGGQLVSIYETARIFREFAGKSSVFIMAADQSPSNVDKAIWVNFLGRETAFLHGPEFYAKKYDLPVVFVDIQRVKRGFYELTLDLITEKPTEMPAGEITQQYANRIEEVIRKNPANWLWSHRRWKHTRN